MFSKIKQTTIHLLRWSQKYTGTDMVYLASGTFWLNLNKALGIVVGLGLSILYARYIDKDVYGNYRYILSFLSMFGFFSLSGMGFAMTRAVARGYERTYVRFAKIIFISTLGITIIGLCSSLYFFFIRQETVIALSLAVGALLIPFVEGTGNWRAYLSGKKAFKEKTAVNIRTKIFYLGLMLVVVVCNYFFELSLLAGTLIMVSGYMLANGLPNAWYQLKYLKQIPKGSRTEPGSKAYGFHLTLAKIPQTIAFYLDGVLLYHYLGPVSLAVYSFAIAPIEQIKGLLNSMTAVAFPKFSTKTAASLRKTLPTKLIKLSAATIIITIIYVVLAPYIYEFLFPQYNESIQYSQIFALSLLAVPLGFLSYALEATKRKKSIYITNSIFPFIQIGLYVALIPQYGILGAVLGKVLGRLISTIGAWAIFNSKTK